MPRSASCASPTRPVASLPGRGWRASTWPSDGHPRQYATFPQKYQVYVRQRKVISLGDFIRRSTGLTADLYKIDHRGYLRPSYFADVVVFDPVGYAPRATYVNPRVPSVGVVALLVNGEVALEQGATTGAAPGRVLLRPRPKPCA